jgi:hypothetical protein
MEVITVSTSESRGKPEPVNDEAQRLHYPPRIPSLLMVVGPIVAAAAVAGVVVLAALTSWWVLFALFALPPLMMMVCGPVMMSAMHSPADAGFPAAGWCPPWRRSDVDRATWAR